MFAALGQIVVRLHHVKTADAVLLYSAAGELGHGGPRIDSVGLLLLSLIINRVVIVLATGVAESI